MLGPDGSARVPALALGAWLAVFSAWLILALALGLWPFGRQVTPESVSSGFAASRPGAPAAASPGAPVRLTVDGEAVAFLTWQPGAQTGDLRVPAPGGRAAAAAPEEPPASPPSLVGARSESGAELLGVVVTDTISDDFTRVGEPVEEFRRPDQQVVIWTDWGGARARRTVAFRWARPDGSLYREVELSDQCPCLAVSRWQLNWEGPNGGDRIIDHPGAWQVEIAIDGQVIGAVEFRVETGSG